MRAMAKNSRRSRRTRERHQICPFAVSRSGRVIQIDRHMTPELHAIMIGKLAASHEQVCTEIGELIGKIRERVSKHDPRVVLQRAFWERMNGLLQVGPRESELGFSHVVEQRMLDYVQAVIVSTPTSGEWDELTDGDYITLKQQVGKLFDLLTGTYILTRTAHIRQQYSSDDQESLYVNLLLHWVLLRGKNYVALEIEHLADLLRPHSDVIREQYGITTDQLVDELRKVLHAHVRGCMESMGRLSTIHEEWRAKVDQSHLAQRIEELGEPAALQESLKQLGLSEAMKAACGQAFYFDLFDLGTLTSLPVQLLEDLALEPGKDQAFFSPGADAGWPTRRLPTWDRPLLKVEGRYYCFDQYALFDHLYRTLERRIVCRAPAYRESWNSRQKVVSEELPLQLLGRILPGAELISGGSYQYRDPATGKAAWADVDGLVIYGDLLLAIEVKAGKFIGDPPAPDLQDYERSIAQLLGDPAEQAHRFLGLIRNSSDLPIYRERSPDAPVLKVLHSEDYRSTHAIAVSVDQLTHLATSIQHRRTQQTLAEAPVWRVSIGDLRVYAAIFRNPLIFCHFLEYRMRAFHSSAIQVDDELDHLGMYLRENDYVRYANAIGADGADVQWQGYTDVLDEYFVKVLEEDGNTQPPQQLMPELLQHSIDILANSQNPDRRRVVCHLLDMDGTSRTGLCEAIESSLREDELSGRSMVYSTTGAVRVTVFANMAGHGSQISQDNIDHALACLLLGKEKERVLLCLEVSAGHQVVWCEGKMVTEVMIITENRGRVEALSARLRQRRIKAASESGRIGRNQACPCGSGRKYKRCCLGVIE